MNVREELVLTRCLAIASLMLFLVAVFRMGSLENDVAKWKQQNEHSQKAKAEAELKVEQSNELLKVEVEQRRMVTEEFNYLTDEYTTVVDQLEQMKNRKAVPVVKQEGNSVFVHCEVE